MSPTARRLLAASALSLASLLAVPGAAEARKGCKSFEGTFTAVRPAECASPVGICTLGTLVGELPSTYEFVVDVIYPAGDPMAPNKLLYTGHSLITLKKGGATLVGQDTGEMYLQPDGTANFVTTVHVVDGTKQYDGATGEIVAPGVLNLTTGETVGTYSGTVCKAGRDRHDD